MNLPNDYARCNGKDWDPFGVQPECINCARRLAIPSDGDEPRWYTAPPPETPCPERIEVQE